MEWRLKPTIQHDGMQLLVLVTWVDISRIWFCYPRHIHRWFAKKSHSCSMCIHVHTILYIRNICWSRFTDGFIYSKHAACYTWGTCSLPLSLMEQSSVHVRIRLNGREPCRFLKQQTHGSPSTVSTAQARTAPFSIFLFDAPFDFQRNKNHLRNHRFSGGPWSFLVGHTEFTNR